MYKLFKIAKNNMKKQKGDMITFFILTLLSVLLIFDSISAIAGLDILDTKFKDINGAHVMLYNGDSEAETDSAEKAFTDNEHIEKYEATPMIQFAAQFKNKKDDEFMDYSFFAESFTEEKEIMQIEKPDKDFGKNDILLPYNMKNSFDEGDTIELKFGDDVIDLNVAGYIEDPYFCSTINITVYSVCMSQEMMDEIADKYPNETFRGRVHKGRINEADLTDDFGTADVEKEVTDSYKDELAVYSEQDPEANYTNYLAVNWDMMRGGSQFLPFLIIALVLVFAVIIFVISIVIISFSVKNFIQKNMKNTGILEASGYTVKELRWALTLQISLVALIGSMVGVIIGILTFDGFGNVVSSVLGLTWNQPVNWYIAIGTVIGVVLVVGLAARRISRRYKKITVLDALRGGITNHNFKKNRFSFEKTPLPISWVLSLKDTFSGLGRNIAMVFIAGILAVSTLIGFGLRQNYGDDPQTLVDMMGFEFGTALVSDNDGNSDYEKVADDLRSIDDVDNVLTLVGFEPTVVQNDKEQTIYTYACDDMKNTTNTIVLEGRTQENDNEIMITQGVADDLGLSVGEMITIKFANNEEDYLIVGINQRMERMGRTIYMTIDGAKKLIPGEPTYSYYVTAKGDMEYDELLPEIEEFEKTAGYDFLTTNMDKMMRNTIDGVSMAVKGICVIIIVITILVVIFVESLVIRAKINRDWRGMGISKALGQTSGGLISQIMLSNIPAILLGTVIGALLSQAAGSGMCKAAFSLFAMKKVPFHISPVYMVITVVGIVAVAILTSGAAGLRVKRLRPISMITED